MERIINVNYKEITNGEIIGSQQEKWEVEIVFENFDKKWVLNIVENIDKPESYPVDQLKYLINEIQGKATTQEERFTDKEVNHIIAEFSKFIENGNK